VTARYHTGIQKDVTKCKEVLQNILICVRRTAQIGEPSDQLGAIWDIYRVFESIEEGDYELLTCELVAPETAEIHINPNGYPYGGIGPFIALAEAFGFRVLGVNEYGKYQSREELTCELTKPVSHTEKP